MKEIMSVEQIHKTLKRITHEIIERNNNLSSLVLVGIEKKGVPLANEIKNNLLTFENINVDCFTLDIRPYRDDNKKTNEDINNLNVQDKDVILVDDVLFTGRSVRAALDALSNFGRPKSVKLAVLVDRGHRELPIRADYIGKNIPTSLSEKIIVDLKQGVLIED